MSRPEWRSLRSRQIRMDPEDASTIESRAKPTRAGEPTAAPASTPTMASRAFHPTVKYSRSRP